MHTHLSILEGNRCKTEPLEEIEAVCLTRVYCIQAAMSEDAQ